jgi:hypothetical protein
LIRIWVCFCVFCLILRRSFHGSSIPAEHGSHLPPIKKLHDGRTSNGRGRKKHPKKFSTLV